MSDQVVPVAVVKVDVEWPREPPSADLLTKEGRVDEHDPSTAQRVLNREHRGIKDKTAFKIDRADTSLTHELRPNVVTRQVGNTDVDDLICFDECGQALARMARGDIRMTQHTQAHGPEQIRDEIRDCRLGVHHRNVNI